LKLYLWIYVDKEAVQEWKLDDLEETGHGIEVFLA
jgi:hypothetical protein